jgi:hypothetical protein
VCEVDVLCHDYMYLEIEEIGHDGCLGMKRESPMGKENRKMWKEMIILLVLFLNIGNTPDNF